MVGAHRASISRLVTSWCRKALVILPVPLKRSRSRRRGVIAAFFYGAATIHVMGRNDWPRCRLAECGCLREEGAHGFLYAVIYTNTSHPVSRSSINTSWWHMTNAFR